MPTVEIEGVGRVQFPDNMSADEITRVIETEILRPERSTAQEIGRQAALAGRYAIEGAGKAVTIPANAISGAISLMTGQPATDYDALLSRGLGMMGLPQPETATERVVGDASRAVASVGGASAVGGLVGGPVGSALQSLPGRQIAGAAGGAGSAGLAREQGVGPAGQLAAGVAGGFAGPMAVDVGQSLVRGAARGLGQVASTLTRSGQEKIAGQVLREQATDPTRAARNLEGAAEVVPGSSPTTGASSRDIGLLALEKGLRSQAPARFGNRLSEQNLARQSILDEISGSGADVVAAKAARNAATAPMREQALSSTAKASTDVVTRHIDDVLQSSVGKREVPAGALQWLRSKLDGVEDAASLYSVRQDIGDAMAGKLGGDQSKFRLARKELIQARDVLDDAIEAAAPGFKAYLNRYREMSKPIDQMEILQEIRRRSALAAPDITTQRDFISQAKFRNAINMAAQKGNLEKLTADQLKTLNAVATDLDLGVAFSNSSVRAPGSDTFQNLSMANAIGAAMGGRSQVPQWMQPIIRPFSWVLRGSDERINELLVDAMLDPKIASKLLQRATPRNAASVSAALRQRANAISRGAALGASTVPQERQEAASR